MRSLIKKKIILRKNLLFFLAVLLLYTIPVSSQQSDDTELAIPDYTIPNINLRLDFDLKVVFLGFDESRLDMDRLTEELIKTHTPVPFWPFISSGMFFPNFTLIKYLINYDFEFITDVRFSNFLEFIETNSIPGIGPNYAPSSNVDFIQTDLVENYLIASGISDPNQPTLVIMDLYTNNKENFNYHYYSINSRDTDQLGTYKIADGGRFSNTIWLDLSAGPTSYLTGTEGEVNEALIPPIWSFSPNETIRLTFDIEEYIQTSIELKFLQSSPFTPLAYFDEIIVDFRMYNSVDSKNISWMNSEFFTAIIDDLIIYNPYVNWSYNFEHFDFEEPIKTEFNSEIASTLDPNTGNYNYLQFNPYLTSNYKVHFGIDDSDPNKKIIPVYIFNMGNKLIGANGIASNNRNGEFTFVLSRPLLPTQIAGLDSELEIKTNRKLLFHEISHALGLSHPFDGFTFDHYFDGKIRYFKYWLWDYTSTTMSYIELISSVVNLDISAMRRGSIPQLHLKLLKDYTFFLNLVKEKSSLITERLIEEINLINETLHLSISSYEDGFADSFNSSLKSAYDSRDSMNLVTANNFTLIGETESNIVSTTNYGLTFISIFGLTFIIIIFRKITLKN